MNRDIDDGLTPISANRGRKNRRYDETLEDYAPERRLRASKTRSGQAGLSRKERFNSLWSKARNSAKNRLSDYDELEQEPRQQVVEAASENDDDYEDYGEIGSNYTPDDDPNWGYDNFDGYEDYENSTYAPDSNNRLPRNIDFSGVNVPPEYPPAGKAPASIDFSGVEVPPEYPPRGKVRDDLNSYLEYIDRYDRGEIDNHDMSRIQRKFANSSFWDTFYPSKKMIREYGSGYESTKWPLFEKKDGRWQPIFWRND